jgi:hypothetical protein
MDESLGNVPASHAEPEPANTGCAASKGMTLGNAAMFGAPLVHERERARRYGVETDAAWESPIQWLIRTWGHMANG